MRLTRVSLALAAIALVTGLTIWGRRAVGVFRMERAEMTAATPAERLPTDLDGLGGIREVGWALSDGTRQRAFFVPGTNGAVVVVAHGSPGTALAMLTEARGLARRGYGVLLIDLPGYGGSDGPRSWGASFREAVRAGVDFAAAQPGVRAIAAYGYSMGTCVALQAAAEDPRIGALVLLAAFTDITEQRAYQYRTRIPGVAAVAIPTARHYGLAVDELDATLAVRKLGDRPLLFVVGDQDEAIPVWMPRRLKELAGNADLWVMPGFGHVGVAQGGGDAYLDRIDAFLRESLGAEMMKP
jgi:pimeloyl-ACP methyl ester carboxylesterase